MTRLLAKRGVTFRRTFTLSGSWRASHFDDIRFVIRSDQPATSVTDDSAALAVATLSGGDITFDGTGQYGTVTITDEDTYTWEPGYYQWGCKGFAVDGAVYDLDSGQLTVAYDIPRAVPTP